MAEFTAVPQGFWQGVDEFNHQEFYACHDTLEALWMEAPEPQKRFYQGVLQIAVGCYHLGHHNGRGAMILLGEGMKRLKDYLPSYEEIDVAQLLEDSSQLLNLIQQTDPEELSTIVQQFNENPDTWPRIIRLDPTV